jgi:putative acetyltransferase
MKVPTTEWVLGVDDVTRADVRHLVRTHRDWSRGQTPPEFSFAVDSDEVTEAGIALFSARAQNGRLLGVGGLKELDERHGEIKTMHTAVTARGLGVGRALLEALLLEAGRRGYVRVSLETGTSESFRPARALYESVGFRPCEAFADYANTEHNVCMTLTLSTVVPPA